MKKNSISLTILSSLSIILSTLLLIFCVPSQIPTLLNLNETIAQLGTKWLLLVFPILILTFNLLSILLTNKNLKMIFSYFCYVLIFQMLLIFIYYIVENTFAVKDTFKIPISILIFLPFSFLTIVYSGILKSLPYKSPLGVKNKYSVETEFLWTQIQILSKDKFLIAGLIMLLVSIIFAFFKLFLVELLIFAIILLITHLLIRKEARGIYEKYLEMKKRKDALEKNSTKK